MNYQALNQFAISLRCGLRIAWPLMDEQRLLLTNQYFQERLIGSGRVTERAMQNYFICRAMGMSPAGPIADDGPFHS